MPSTYSSRIRLEKQADGENPNSWGDILNQNVIDLVDDAIGGIVTIGTAGVQIVGDNTLSTNNGSSDEARSAIIELQGYVVSVSAANIVLPAVSKFYIVNNQITQTSATGTVRIMNTGATATGYVVNTTTTGDSTFVIMTDGTNVKALDPKGLGLPGGTTGAASRSVITSIGEIETTTVDPITSVTATGNYTFIANYATVDPALVALSTTDIRYANVSIGYGNTFDSYNTFSSEVKVSGGYSYSPLVTVAVSDTSIFAIDLQAGNNFVFQVSADSTLRQPDNMNVGQQGVIYVIQDGTTGGKTVSFASDFKFQGGTVPTITTTTSAVDLLAYCVRSVEVSASVTTAFIDMVAVQDMKR